MTVKNLKYNTYLLVKIVGIFFYRQHTVNGNRFPECLYIYSLYSHIWLPIYVISNDKERTQEKNKIFKNCHYVSILALSKKSHHEIMNFAI